MSETSPAYVPAASMRAIPIGRHVIAFYDGRDDRIPYAAANAAGYDGGTLRLGIASYAVVDGQDALVYDTHISLEHARKIRAHLEGLGVTRLRVILSHWHYDHVAGNEAFADCEIIANRLTRDHLFTHRDDMEAGKGHPPILPLVMPTRVYDGSLDIEVGGIRVELRHADIHSDDETLLLLPAERLLIAGDALEDPITYVAEPHGLARHLADLDRISSWPFDRILPCHGSPQRIAAGGYDKTFVRATQQYVRTLLRAKDDAGLRAVDLKTFIHGPLTAGWVDYLPAYEAVHRENIAAVCGSGPASAS